jgi:hypothetical protein
MLHRGRIHGLRVGDRRTFVRVTGQYSTWMIELPVAVGMIANVGWGRRCFMAMALLGVSLIVGTLVGVSFTSYG